MNSSEYRASKCQEAAAVFFSGVAGKEMMDILRREAEPKMGATQAYGTHEDVKMQMSINLVDSLAKLRIIRIIEALTKPPSKSNDREMEDLEPDPLPVRKPKKQK